MKKTSLSLIIAFSIFSLKSNGQVGINTSAPNSTLDVIAKNTTGSSSNVDGVLIPRVDRLRAQSMASVPTSTLIYINNVTTGVQSGQTANVDAVGYYYFNGTAWVKLHNPSNTTFSSVNLYNTDGSLTGNRIVTQGTNTLAFTSNAVNGFSVDGNTLSVDAVNNRVGIGNASPGTDLHVGNGTNGSVIPTIRLTTSQNAFSGGGVLQFLENNEGNGTIIRHHTGDNSATEKEGLYFNSFSALVESTTPTLMLDQNAQNVGIGTAAPSNKLHVSATANPLRLDGLQPSSGSSGTLAVNSTGVVQLRNSSSISAVRIVGNVTITSNNTITATNISSAPTKTFDNLNEFSGNTFTASATGLYRVIFSINFPQRFNTEDGGDGYAAITQILLNGMLYDAASIKVPLPESGGAPIRITCNNDELVKMNSGDTLSFRVQTYGSSPDITNIIAPYIIKIVRIE